VSRASTAVICKAFLSEHSFGAPTRTTAKDDEDDPASMIKAITKARISQLPPNEWSVEATSSIRPQTVARKPNPRSPLSIRETSVALRPAR